MYNEMEVFLPPGPLSTQLSAQVESTLSHFDSLLYWLYLKSFPFVRCVPFPLQALVTLYLVDFIHICMCIFYIQI